MPGLFLFKRRWAIGSDDFVFSSFGEALLRIAWIVVLLVIYTAHRSGFDCPNGSDLTSFYIGTVVFNIIDLILVLILMGISMRGTIKDAYPRRHLCWFLYMKLFMLLPEGVWVCLTTYWTFGHPYSCEWSVVRTARGAVIFSWVFGFAIFIGIVTSFDPVGSAKQRQAVNCRMTREGDETLTVGPVSATKAWETRCRFLCCCIACNRDTRQAFKDVGQIVADFFKDLDVVPSDLAAGLILVQKQQINMEMQLNTVMVNSGYNTEAGTSSGLAGSLPQPKDWMTVNNMAHYMKFAMGSYGWPFYMFDNLCTGFCRLCTQWSKIRRKFFSSDLAATVKNYVKKKSLFKNALTQIFQTCQTVKDDCYYFISSLCCNCIRKANSVFSDNICQCNTAAIKKLSNVKDDDLIYVTFHNSYKRIPFYVVVDREKGSVVVSIRGTLSLQDALADISAKGAVLEIPGVDSSYCHSAMLDCATYIKQQLESMEILERAFLHIGGDNVPLVITGHSLGAGVAAILSVLLKPKYPNLICFSFSPPGGLMSLNASKYTQDFVCAVVIGKDLVPRLGMPTLIDLKVKLLRAIVDCNKPKYRILASGFFRLLCCSPPTGSNESEDDQSLIRNRGSRYTEETHSVLMEDQMLQNALRLSEAEANEVHKSEWPLHPAGQILHVIEKNEGSSCREDPQYEAIWSSPAAFNRIVISHKMVTDHIPNIVGKALDQLAGRNYVPSAKMPVIVTEATA